MGMQQVIKEEVPRTQLTLFVGGGCLSFKSFNVLALARAREWGSGAAKTGTLQINRPIFFTRF